MKQFSEYTTLLFVDLIADTYNIREVQFIYSTFMQTAFLAERDLSVYHLRAMAGPRTVHRRDAGCERVSAPCFYQVTQAPPRARRQPGQVRRKTA